MKRKKSNWFLLRRWIAVVMAITITPLNVPIVAKAEVETGGVCCWYL